MSQALPLPPPGFESLSIEEQIEYVEALWAHVAAGQRLSPIPRWHKEVLAERMKQERGDGDKTWDEFEQELNQE